MRALILFCIAIVLTPVAAVAQDRVIWSGGVGAGERAEAPDTGTRLEFFARSGAFLAYVDVVIRNSDGQEVVNTRVNGPWLIVDLPDGSYTVDATIDDRGSASAEIEIGNQPVFGIMFVD